MGKRVRTQYGQSIHACTYRATIDGRLCPALGSIKLQALRTDSIQALVNRQRAELSPATIRRGMSILKRALGQAVENQLISATPPARSSSPRQSKKRFPFCRRGKARPCWMCCP